jgi:chemotaxis signal transduction protein
MAGYVQIGCFRYHLLVDTRHVLEVLELETADDRHGSSRWLWRGSSIQVLDLRILLGTTGQPLSRSALVYGESDPSFILLCDKVFGLVQGDEAAFRKLPHSAGRISHFVDAVLPESSTGLLRYRLKCIRDSTVHIYY